MKITFSFIAWAMISPHVWFLRGWSVLVCLLFLVVEPACARTLQEIQESGSLVWALPLGTGALGILLVFVLWNRRLSKAMRERQKIQRELKTNAEALESHSSVGAHIAKISKDIQKASTFAELAQTFMSQSIPLAGMEFGVLYALDKDKGQLVQIGGYGTDAGKDSQRAFTIGQGLVGQCALEKKPITIADTTDAGIFINWGMGEVVPKEILFEPLVQRGEAIGVLELASVRAFGEQSLSILRELTPTLAMNIEILDRNLRTRSLLDATQEQASTLQAQAETLRKQQEELKEASLKREEANKALQKQVEELASARRVMMNIMEDLEASRKETESRNIQTQKLLDETSLQADKLRVQQEQIKETEIWFRGIIESAPDGMLVIDERGGIILTNKLVEDMFGYSSGELEGEIIEILVPESVRGRHVGLRESYIQTGLSRQFGQSFELRGVRKDGYEFPVEIGLAILPAMGSKGRCVCASIRDITERKKIEEELKQHMEELEKFEKLTVNREEKMIELKQEINTLLTQTGKEEKYIIVE